MYTSGIDQKVTQFSLLESSSSKGNSTPSSLTKWVRTASKRMHSHDVRGLSIWPPYTPLPSPHRRSFPTNVVPLLVSGGLDMSVVVTPAALPRSSTARPTNPLATSVTATFEDAYHRRIAYSSGAHGTVGLHLAKHARLVLSTGDTDLAVWRLPKKPSVEEEPPLALSGEGTGWKKVLEMSLRVQTNLVASAISDDGRWLAVSDALETKLFWLQVDVRVYRLVLHCDVVHLTRAVLGRRLEAQARSRPPITTSRTPSQYYVVVWSFCPDLFSRLFEAHNSHKNCLRASA